MFTPKRVRFGLKKSRKTKTKIKSNYVINTTSAITGKSVNNSF